MSDAAGWDRRYAGTDLVWSAGPNAFVAEVCSSLAPGRAIDLAAGEGRNSIWLAERGWEVTAVDFSAVAADKGRALAASAGPGTASRIEWVVADLAAYRAPTGTYQLVVMAYLQVPAPLRRAALLAAADAVDEDGRVVVVAHDRSNLERGTGGPQDPEVLYGPEDVAADLGAGGLRVTRSERVRRPVDGHRDAIDLLVVATRAAAGSPDR